MTRNTLKSKGFTLVELLVSIGILVLMTSSVLANYRNYNTNALFANASEDIVLALRQAQVYGVGVKGTGASFDVPYGVYFVLNNNGLTVFADTNKDHVFTSGENAGLESASAIWGSTISINRLLCGGIDCTGGVASATFSRPNPDAFIADIANQAASYDTLSILLKDSNTGKTATVVITKAGQISLQ